MFLGARSPGRVEDKCSTKTRELFNMNPNGNENSGDAPSTLSLTAKRLEQPQRQQMREPPTLSEPARVRENRFVSDVPSGDYERRTHMSDSMHFRVFADYGLDGTVRKDRKANGGAGTGHSFPRLLTPHESLSHERPSGRIRDTPSVTSYKSIFYSCKQLTTPSKVCGVVRILT